MNPSASDVNADSTPHFTIFRLWVAALVSATAVLGGDTRQKNWLSGENYTLRLSAIIKLARMMVALDTSHGHTNLRTPSLTELQDHVDRFMTSGISTPMQWIMMLRGYGMSIQFDSTTLVTTHRDTTFSTTAMMRYRSKETHGCSNAFATIPLCGAGAEGFLEKGVEKMEACRSEVWVRR
ncbi:hypothetical protein MMC22_003917 [Lobaria immixta]|nr:hypothetical protein [Lobaria immixta]